MYVIAKHRIVDADRFLSLAQSAAENAPAGVFGRQFCPSRDGSEAVCLWEADSVDSVRTYLDAISAGAAENAYFEVGSEHAIGIPEPIHGPPMETPVISFATYSAAENYQRYFVPAIAAPVSTELLDRAALKPGERVLDVACGTGLIARLAAEGVGRKGSVAGVDINSDMLAVARSIPSPGAQIEWCDAPAEELPFEENTFDAALCQLGLQFFPDKLAALSEMHRVLVRGGRIVVNVPGLEPALFTSMEEKIGRYLGPEAAGFLRLVFSLYDEGELGDLLRGAGFEGVEVSAKTERLRLSPPREFLWQYVWSTPLAAAAVRLDEDGRQSLESEVVEAWEPFTDAGNLILEVGMATGSGRVA